MTYGVSLVLREFRIHSKFHKFSWTIWCEKMLVSNIRSFQHFPGWLAAVHCSGMGNNIGNKQYKVESAKRASSNCKMNRRSQANIAHIMEQESRWPFLLQNKHFALLPANVHHGRQGTSCANTENNSQNSKTRHLHHNSKLSLLRVFGKLILSTSVSEWVSECVWCNVSLDT